MWGGGEGAFQGRGKNLCFIEGGVSAVQFSGWSEVNFPWSIKPQEDYVFFVYYLLVLNGKPIIIQKRRKGGDVGIRKRRCSSRDPLIYH